MMHRKYDVDKLIKNLHDYIDKIEYPVLAEFAYKHRIPRQYIYEIAKNKDRDDVTEEERDAYQALSDAIKRLHDKAEAYLLKTEPCYSKAIFVLKQPAFGYTDRQDIATDTQITVNFNIPRPSASPLPTVDITPKLGGKQQQNN